MESIKQMDKETMRWSQKSAQKNPLTLYSNGKEKFVYIHERCIIFPNSNNFPNRSIRTIRSFSVKISCFPFPFSSLSKGMAIPS